MLNHSTDPAARNTSLSLCHGDMEVKLESGEIKAFTNFFSMRAGEGGGWLWVSSFGGRCSRGQSRFMQVYTVACSRGIEGGAHTSHATCHAGMQGEQGWVDKSP